MKCSSDTRRSHASGNRSSYDDSCARRLLVRIALAGGHVITGTGESLDDGLVVIEDERIVSVGSSNSATGADVTIDLEGRALLPGLIDVHIHMVGGDKSIGFDDKPPLMRTDPPAVAEALLEGVSAARTMLRAGFTTVREVGGRDYHDVSLRNAQRSGLVEGPRILASGPGVFPTGGLGAHLEPDAGVNSDEDAVRRVREMVARGVDVIKIVSADGPQQLGKYWTVFPTREEIESVFREATRLGRVKAAHAMGSEAIEDVCAAGTDTVEHGWYMSEQNCQTLITHGAYLVPTVSNVWAIVKRGPELKMPWAPMIASEERDILDRLRMAIEMGVKIAMGTDVGGNVAHRYGDNAKELEIYVDCGMSPMEAVMAGTLEAARAIHRDEIVGSIEPGKIADLIVIDGDPLTDIGLTRTGIAAVVQGGVLVRDDLGVFDGLRALRE
jgi:imidazolonepropionase-like amidohydrolase